MPSSASNIQHRTAIDETTVQNGAKVTGHSVFKSSKAVSRDSCAALYIESSEHE